MKRMKILLLTVTIALITASVISAQETNPVNDTATVSIQQSGSGTQTQAQEQNRTANQEQAQTGVNAQVREQNKAGNASGVKKVLSARPDWSKARGARPPSVERPSGSRIPKGVGKPGGAKGPGKR